MSLLCIYRTQGKIKKLYQILPRFKNKINYVVELVHTKAFEAMLSPSFMQI